MLKKDITFIYMDSAEKSFMLLLEKEAKSRGYVTKVTDNKFEKCEIGVYCQHRNFPQFSKFSVIMLHDIIQQYSRWPDIWFLEPWNKYDVGILPSDQWVNNWNQCSGLYYACPRKGMYKVGWPKADVINDIDRDTYRKEFNQKYGLDDTKRTVLYAPAWENDNKQDDFVQAMLKLNVNILIKQCCIDPTMFPKMYASINEMAKLHENIPGVTILPPQMNIFNAILASDILVSEESSTMSEAAMVGVPAISVSDWLIPDVIPSRYPECNYDFVIMTKKSELQSCVEEMLEHYDKYRTETEDYANRNFANVGKSCKMILDIIDDYVENREVRYEKLTANEKQNIKLMKRLHFVAICIKREIHDNYCERHPVLMSVWNVFRDIKKKIYK